MTNALSVDGTDTQAMTPESEPYFGPESMLYRVQNERVVGLLYGFRALVIGAAHPVPFIGTQRHTDGIDAPIRRLARTAEYFEAPILGSRHEADRALRITKARHKPVHGTLPETAGKYQAGTTYSAYDPDLMLWTWAVAADSSFVMYENLVRPLNPTEREELYQDWLRWAELFSMPRSAAPATYPEFQEYWQAKMTCPDLHATPAARLVTEHALLSTKLAPPHLAPAMRLRKLLILGTTPPAVRDVYGLRWTRADEVTFRAMAAAVRAGRIALPDGLRHGRCTPVFQYMARYEQKRVDRGEQPIPGIEACI